MTQPLASSMYGAVDLSGLAQSASPAQAGADGSISGPYVLDVTPDNLRSVLETSNQLPVVISFYAEQSEASGKLTSQLEALAGEARGHFQLGKVDVGAYPEVAQAFGLQGVPAAVALIQAQPVPLFQGSPDDNEIAPLINRVLETAAQYGMTAVLSGEEEAGEPTPPARPPHQAAGFDAVDAGDLETAKAEFTQALKDNPGDEESQKMLAQVELVERVREVADPVALMQQAQASGLHDVPTQLSAADVECYTRRPEAAFQRLIDVISVTSGDERETARKRLLELFEIVGSENPAVGQARKALAMALFS